MTKDEITTIARRLFPLLPHPTKPDEPWWTPGLCSHCEALGRSTKHNTMEGVGDVFREIPPPDPMDWEVFGRLLMWVLREHYTVEVHEHCTFLTKIDTGAWADDPCIALLLAIAKIKGVVK